MKEELYQWMKNLAVFYIVFSAILHLVPDRKYERYVRSFMGLLLIYLLCTPVFAVLGKSAELIEDFAINFQLEQRILEKRESEDLQAFYLNRGYERELAAQITDICRESGINPVDAAVHIEGERITAEILAAEQPSEEQADHLREKLKERLGIAQSDCRILTEELPGENETEGTEGGEKMGNG